MNPVLSPALAFVILVIFGFIWVGFGYWLGRNNKTLSDFMLAGRNVGLALATATAMATWVTSNTTMTAPQLTYQLGVWGMVGYSLGAVGLLMFAPLATRIKVLLPCPCRILQSGFLLDLPWIPHPDIQQHHRREVFRPGTRGAR